MSRSLHINHVHWHLNTRFCTARSLYESHPSVRLAHTTRYLIPDSFIPHPPGLGAAPYSTTLSVARLVQQPSSRRPALQSSLFCYRTLCKKLLLEFPFLRLCLIFDSPYMPMVVCTGAVVDRLFLASLSHAARTRMRIIPSFPSFSSWRLQRPQVSGIMPWNAGSFCTFKSLRKTFRAMCRSLIICTTLIQRWPLQVLRVTHFISNLPRVCCKSGHKVQFSICILYSFLLAEQGC